MIEMKGFLSSKELEEILATSKKKEIASQDLASDEAWDAIMDKEIRAIEECTLDPSDPDYPY